MIYFWQDWPESRITFTLSIMTFQCQRIETKFNLLLTSKIIYCLVQAESPGIVLTSGKNWIQGQLISLGINLHLITLLTYLWHDPQADSLQMLLLNIAISGRIPHWHLGNFRGKSELLSKYFM